MHSIFLIFLFLFLEIFILYMYIECSSEVEPDDLEEDTLHLPDQEEEDLNRIKEESRRRREAIMEKYKNQHQKVEVVGNERKGLFSSFLY